MDKKTIGAITVITTIFLCGLPGLAGLCFGLLAIIGVFIPVNAIPSEDTSLVAGFSIMILGLSLVFIAIPISFGIWVWWSQKSDAAAMEKLSIPVEDF